MPSGHHLARSAVCLAVTALLWSSTGCSPNRPEGLFSMIAKPAPAKLSLDPELSPVSFRWLADDAVLVAPKVGERKLAGFGNYVGRAALKVENVRVAVWDDEAAWKLASRQSGDGDVALAHKRAEFVKETAGPDPVERYLVFGPGGDVVYQRDFRAYPITDLD